MSRAGAAVPPAVERAWPSVSVVVVNLDGRDYLQACLEGIRALDYPTDRVEVVLIDNASTDGSVELTREDFPEVRVVVNDRNTGFSPAVNQGAQLASGRYLALINNDAVPDRGWLREAVKVLEAEPAVAVAASKILRDDRETLDYSGGQVAFYGHGFARKVNHPDDRDERNRPTLFASGGGMIARRATFLDVGGFDESFFAFFEDVDLGWRLWLLGHEVRYVPSSKVYHRHHGTIERFGYARERYLLERNALACVFKNWGDDRLARVLPASLVLTVLRGLEAEGMELPDYRISADALPLEEGRMPALTGAHLAAVRDWAADLDDLSEKRARIQAARRRDDRQVMKLFEESLTPNIHEPEFLRAFDNVLDAFGLRDHARSRSNVLLLTEERLGEVMSAGAVRCWEMAKLLAHEHEVTLASTVPVERSHAAFQTMHVSEAHIDALVAASEVIICHGAVLRRFPQVTASERPVLVDAHDLLHLRALRRRHADSDGRGSGIAGTVNDTLQRADFVVCAGERQRDFWLGQLAALGRVNPATFDADRSLRSLVAVAPSGVRIEPPSRRAEPPHPALRDVVGGIGREDFVVLADASPSAGTTTLLRAVAKLAVEHDDVRACLIPSTGQDGDAAARLAEKLGLLGSHVFVLEPVSYERLGDYLSEGDVGVSLRGSAVDEELSAPLRLLDFWWAGVPTVTTAGQPSGDAPEAAAGLVVPADDVDELATALKRLRNDDSLRAASSAAARAAAQDLTWDRTLAPIVDFCRQPRTAPDRTGRAAGYLRGSNIVLTRSPVYYVRRFMDYTRAVGPATALLHVRNFVRSRLPRS